MKLPVFIAHGAAFVVVLPVLFISAICLLVATCLRIFQDKSESPKPRRWLTVAGFGVLAIIPFSNAIIGFIERAAAR
jgi:hypothetical protein